MSAERERPAASAASGTPAATDVAASGAVNDAGPDGFSAPWCAGPGQDVLARLEVMYWITRDYESDRTADCETAGLLSQPIEELRAAWWDYLIGYSAALAGCPPLPVEVPGGIRAFGPANTAAIGVPRPRLGMDDVSSLISKYMAAFAAELGLTADERQAAEMHLWTTAEGEMDPSASDVLSTCDASGP
jgi:hypothetical protein